ncbi:MAG: acetolactate synthase small subunit [Candidatus Bipolaricaulota bacterium]
MSDPRLHPLTALVKNESGVLSKISGLFARRGFNIDSLAVGETSNPSYSRMSIVFKGEKSQVEQVVRQLEKQISVISVKDLSKTRHLERELAIFKVRATEERRSEIVELVDIFKGKVLDVGKQFLAIEITGGSEKVRAFENLLRDFGIEEMARTGKVLLERSPIN